MLVRVQGEHHIDISTPNPWPVLSVHGIAFRLFFVEFHASAEDNIATITFLLQKLPQFRGNIFGLEMCVGHPNIVKIDITIFFIFETFVFILSFLKSYVQHDRTLFAAWGMIGLTPYLYLVKGVLDFYLLPFQASYQLLSCLLAALRHLEGLDVLFCLRDSVWSSSPVKCLFVANE